MRYAQYRLTLRGEPQRAKHFELRLDDTNRPFHLSFRTEPQLIVFNSMAAGKWDKEVRAKAPALFEPGAELVVEIFEASARISCAGQEVWDIPLARHPASARPHVVNVDWRATDEGDLLDPVGGDARLMFGGMPIQLPDRPVEQPDWLPRVLTEQMDVADQYRDFLATVMLDDALLVVDLFAESHLCGIFHALLNPSVQVLCLCQSDAERGFVADLAQRNGLANTTVVSNRELERILAGRTDTPVMVQGRDVYSQHAGLLAQLRKGSDSRIDIFSIEGVPVATDTALGSGAQPNLCIRTGPFAFHHRAPNSGKGPRPGVDVVVAAYNAGEYLGECVESLLCDGRDDVRVIISDDGSTDGSPQAAADRFAADARVRVVSKKNGGCASARNYGRIASDASHIAFVDADDFVTPDFFADLYDLARYTGGEITQAGFDFFDAARDDPIYPSYEDAAFAAYPRTQFRDQPVIRLDAKDIIKGQPSIWRRVYRRDFLDARDIYFPENVRAYDDYVFHLFSLHDAGQVHMMPEHKYHYRQHPAQDIKQGDERHFYMPYMFQMILRRSVDHAWADFRPYCASIVDCINWSAHTLRPDLVGDFLAACARVCVAIRKVYGPGTLTDAAIGAVRHSDFRYYFQKELDRVDCLEPGTHWALFPPPQSHPDLVKLGRARP